jgi:hypothetical protein
LSIYVAKYKGKYSLTVQCDICSKFFNDVFVFNLKSDKVTKCPKSKRTSFGKYM